MTGEPFPPRISKFRNVVLCLICFLVSLQLKAYLPGGYVALTTRTISSTRLLRTLEESVHHPEQQGQDDPNQYGSDPLAVFRVWNEYKQQHSVEQLRRELVQDDTSTYDRRFAVAFYNCPFQAGNRMHHWMNSILWAVMTNRTILWKYFDKETCSEFGYPSLPFCKAANQEEDCRKVLRRPSWIASYDEWIVNNRTKRASLLDTAGDDIDNRTNVTVHQYTDLKTPY